MFETAEDIHARIRHLMDERQWGKNDLVKACKAADSTVNDSTIFTMLKRESYPTIPVLIQVCKGFGIDLVDFFKDESSGLVVYQSDEPVLERYHKMYGNTKLQCLDMMDTMIKYNEGN